MEDFVTFEIAKKLKEKGFKEKCVAYYWEKIDEHTPSFLVEDNIPEDGLCVLDLLSNHNSAEWSPFIDAPTISQVLKWLEDKKKIFLTVDIESMGFFFIINYDISINNNGEFEFNIYNSINVYSSPTGAALAGIEYVIDNIL